MGEQWQGEGPHQEVAGGLDTIHKVGSVLVTFSGTLIGYSLGYLLQRCGVLLPGRAIPFLLSTGVVWRLIEFEKKTAGRIKDADAEKDLERRFILAYQIRHLLTGTAGGIIIQELMI